MDFVYKIDLFEVLNMPNYTNKDKKTCEQF